ncbi:MAG: MmgE/PrpD family protein, partial [Alphaproteobacteria bacterium]
VFAAAPGFDPGAIRRVELGVNPLCLVLCDRPAPQDAQRAQVSLQHWAAAALTRGKAGIAEGSDAAVADPAILATRAKIAAMPDESVGRDGAVVRVFMTDGTEHARRIEHGVGSLEQPITNTQLDAKFLDQARLSLPDAAAREALALCRRLPDLDDAGAVARAAQAGAA